MATCRTRLSERSNSLTAGLDVATPGEIVRLLRAVDVQMFVGFEEWPALADAVVLDALEAAAAAMARVLAVPGGKVVFSGCGTSGRLAFVCARRFNELASPEEECRFEYLIAGGDRALVTAQEAGEDDARAGAAELEALVKDSPAFAYVGITCGLSAPYVAGQLDLCRRDERATAVVLGFNPPELARDAPIEGFPHTFRDVLFAARSDGAHVLTPVVGPEAVTGSTRMKGGSATKLLLEALFLGAVHRRRIRTVLDSFYDVYRDTYQRIEDIAELMTLAGHCLCDGRRVAYVGADGLGLIGFVDASEQPPTFGAALEDVRGFMCGGWKAIRNREGDLSSVAPCYRISAEGDLEAHLGPGDVLFVLRYIADVSDAAQEHHPVNVASLEEAGVVVRDVVVAVDAAREHLPDKQSRFLGEFSAKLIVNAISTGAHVLKGQVYGNRMVNLRLSNNKLFFRAISIVRTILELDSDHEAKRLLLRSIYDDEVDNKTEEETPVSEHIASAAAKPFVLPVALMIAREPSLSANDARQMLLKERVPIVRKILANKNDTTVL